MKHLLWTAAALTLLTGAGGCTLYFGGDDGDDCYYGGGDGADALEAVGYRNPDTGACEDWGGGGGGGGCGAYDYAAPEPAPDWAQCWGYCEGLDEATCLETSGCRAAYQDGWDTGVGACPEGTDCDAPVGGFMGCWGTAPSGPVQGGGCAALDAYECSRHDDCTAHYATAPDGWYRFSYCADEPWSVGCYSDMDCPGGYECNADVVCESPPCDEAGCPDVDVCYGQCVPVDLGCAAVDCGAGYHCELECFPCDSAEPSGGCDPFCNPTCVPDTWVCEGVDCGPGSHCEEVCTDSLPGTCYSSCVPDEPTPACATITDEAACDARTDCIPVYTGYGCTCDPDGTCDCVTWEFARCDAAVVPF